MISELLQAFFFIFMAEMGDKTQLLAMAFATKYSLSKVLIGVAIGSFLNHGLAALLGRYLTQLVPLDLIRLIAAFAFIIFGLWALKVDTDNEEDGEKVPSKHGPVIMVASAFFLGEMGDKTQLTVITLSTTFSYPLIMLLGTVAGMVFTSAIGVFVGSKLGKKIPEVTIKIISAAIFISFGLVSLWEATPEQFLTTLNILLFLCTLSLLVLYLLNRIRLLNKDITPVKRRAHKLYLNTKKLQMALSSIPTAHTCTSCNNQCTIKCLQDKLDSAVKNEQYITDEKWNIPICHRSEFNDDMVRISLLEAIKTCQNCPSHAENCVGSQTRQILEKLYFGREIPFDGDMKKYREQIKKIDPNFFYELF